MGDHTASLGPCVTGFFMRARISLAYSLAFSVDESGRSFRTRDVVLRMDDIKKVQKNETVCVWYSGWSVVFLRGGNADQIHSSSLPLHMKRARDDSHVVPQVATCGTMCIRTGDESTWLDWRRGIAPCTPEAFQEMKTFLGNVRSTPNPRRPSTNILRKQCAIVVPSSSIVSYDFGQKQETFNLSNVSLSMVSTVLALVHGFLSR